MRFIKGLIKSLTTTIIFVLVAEATIRGAYYLRNSVVRYVPLPYAVSDQYGPIPPWLDRLLILVPDDALIWKSAPNVRRTYVDIFSPVDSERDRIALLRRFSPTLPNEFRSNPRWTIALNSRGDRGPEAADAPAPDTTRIACVGDSWTFGMPFDQDQTYPSRLAAWLREERPSERFEVMNFGVLGYSSFQGLELFKRRVISLHPRVVVIGFGMNDSEVDGYRDKDMVGGEDRPSIARHVKGAVKAMELYNLLNYTALVLRFRPKPIGEYLKEEGEAKSGPINYDDLEPWTRVSPADYETNIREMIRLGREHGARAILVDNELWDDSPYRPVLRRLSRELDVPLVDSFAILEDARKRIEHDVESMLGLKGTSYVPVTQHDAGTTVVFRVYRGAYAVPKALSIVGADPQLGAFAPNTVTMHDDGTGGDERARDGVWTYAARFAPGARLSYMYTNSGEPGRWQGLDVPMIRSVRVPAANDGGAVALPIDTFGRIYMQGDNWHTDAVGYDLIGHGVARAIESLPR